MKHIMWKWTLVVWMGLLAAVPAIGADTKISAEPAASALDGTELLPCVQSATNKKCTTAQVKTLANTSAVRATTTTSEALANSDQGKLVTFSNASPVACTIAQASSGGNFVAGWVASLKNLGAGTVTCTPTTSTVDGAASFTLTQGQGVDLYSDGTNYFTQPGKGAAGANPSATAGPNAVNGSAVTFMRSDGAPAVQQGTNAQKGIVQVDDTSIGASSGVIGTKAASGDCTSTAGSLSLNCRASTPTYIVNNWYVAGGETLNSTASSAVVANGTAYCYPAYFHGPATITALGVRVNTTSAGTNWQVAIYASNNSTGRPTGSPLVTSGNLSSASSGAVSSGAVSLAVSDTRILWFCANSDNGTSTVNGMLTRAMSGWFGTATQGNLLNSPDALSGVSSPLAFNTWSDLTSATFTERQSSTVFPALEMKIGSVP